VGAEGFSGNVVYENIHIILGWNGVTHISMVKTNSSFRKMGHVTIVNKRHEWSKKIAEDKKYKSNCSKYIERLKN
jgi:5-(carboxyamino)imidazole ribonucleotide synthase